jgi:hypothetical protein
MKNAMTAEEKLIDRLLKIEALHASTEFDGERKAAEHARDSILGKLGTLKDAEDPLEEYQFSMPDPWKRKLLCALLRRYDIRPFRYYRQRHSTVMAKVSPRFVDETLWPEFLQVSEELSTYLDEITNRVIGAAFGGDVSDPEEMAAISG